MSSLLKSAQSKQGGRTGKSKFGPYLSNTIYILTILAVLGFLYQSFSTFFLGN
jgi:hypothetical protein